MRDMTLPNAVLFDLYGTLIYEEPDSVALQLEMATLLGVGAEAFLAARARTLNQSMRGEYATTRDRAEAVFQLLGISDQERIDLLVREEERLRRQSVRLCPGARETLIALRSLGLPTGLVSNGTNMWRIFLNHLALEQHFDAIALSCELGRCKPEAEIFLWATDRLGVQPEECMFVGDGDGGEMEAARDLGMTAVLIDHSWSWVRRTGTRVYHDRRISHLGELLGIVSGPT